MIVCMYVGMYVCIYDDDTAARAREDARDGLDVPDATLMGGGDDISRKLQQRKEREAKKMGEKEK